MRARAKAKAVAHTPRAPGGSADCRIENEVQQVLQAARKGARTRALTTTHVHQQTTSALSLSLSLAPALSFSLYLCRPLCEKAPSCRSKSFNRCVSFDVRERAVKVMHAVLVGCMHTCRFSRIVFCLFSEGMHVWSICMCVCVCLGVVGYSRAALRQGRPACRSGARDVLLVGYPSRMSIIIVFCSG
jgi:hypothetical protein